MKNQFHKSLNESRDEIFLKIKSIFKKIAIEAHVLGSVARGNPDPYSDLDVWLTIDDSVWDEFKKTRTKLFLKIGQIIHTCEPPQNAPLDGLFTSLFIKQNDNIIVVDFYLCPKHSAFITNESKNIFGDIPLPVNELSLNPQQIPVPETYRIDFFLCFIFGTIKKIVRRKENALELVLIQYNNLSSKYKINVRELETDLSPFGTLTKIIENTKEVAIAKQIGVLNEFQIFIDQVKSLENSSSKFNLHIF